MEVFFQTTKLPRCRHSQHLDRRGHSYGSDPNALAIEDAS